MANPLVITVKESIKELKALQRNQGELISKRIQMLLVIKKHESTGLSKRALSDMTGINHNSIVKWRQMYLKGGISDLLVHGRKGGFKPSLVKKEEHTLIEQKLNDPNNGLRGYSELLEWVQKELSMDIKYKTLHSYVVRNFGTKIKVARKSHVKKDEEKVALFKKTSV